MFGPNERVKIKATGETGTVVAFYPEDDEYRVERDGVDGVNYYLGGDLERVG